MKKAAYLLLIVQFSWITAVSQKNDYVWLQGYKSSIGFVYNTTLQTWYGTTFMNFNQEPVELSFDSIEYSVDQTNTSFCDNNGNLKLYSNCVNIYNSQYNIMENGDSINWGDVITIINPLIASYGYRHEQGMYALPNPSNVNECVIINTLPVREPSVVLYFRYLVYHVVNLDANFGLGKVTQRDVKILDSRLSSEIAAVRHANGRDWWIILQNQTTNCYHTILLDPSGFHVLPQNTNCGGPIQPFQHIGVFAQSPDGNKLVYAHGTTGITIFDFDRCSGLLTHPVVIPSDSGFYVNGASISPNSRFLYISGGYYAYQYDLWATDIAASKDTVAVYDGHESPFNSLFGNMQLAPNGKIYVDCGNGSNVLHAINQPDKKGDSCDFAQHSVPLISFTSGIPNYPNYRLGALAGSPCDTLDSNPQPATNNEQLIKVYPNPATEFIVIDYGFTNWSKDAIRLEVSNTLGQVIYEQAPPMYSGIQKISITQWPSGIYTATIKRGESVVAVNKFVKQ